MDKFSQSISEAVDKEMQGLKEKDLQDSNNTNA